MERKYINFGKGNFEGAFHLLDIKATISSLWGKLIEQRRRKRRRGEFVSRSKIDMDEKNWRNAKRIAWNARFRSVESMTLDSRRTIDRSTVSRTDSSPDTLGDCDLSSANCCLPRCRRHLLSRRTTFYERAWPFSLLIALLDTRCTRCNDTRNKNVHRNLYRCCSLPNSTLETFETHTLTNAYIYIFYE